MRGYNVFLTMYYNNDWGEHPSYEGWLRDTCGETEHLYKSKYRYFAEVELCRVLRDETFRRHVIHIKIQITDPRQWHIMKLKKHLDYRMIMKISQRYDQRVSNNGDLFEVDLSELNYKDSV